MKISFSNPYLLLLLVPALFITLFPYLRLKKAYRQSANRIISLCLHLVIVLMLGMLIGGLSVTVDTMESNALYKDDIILLVDKSYSTKNSAEQIDSFVKEVADSSKGKSRLGIIAFNGTQTYVAPLNKNAQASYNKYINADFDTQTDITDIASALIYAHSMLDEVQNSRIILLSDGLETEGTALAVTRAIAAQGTIIDAVHFPTVIDKNEVQISDVRLSTHTTSPLRPIDITVKTNSAVRGFATITISDNGNVIITDEVYLSGSADTFSFMHTFTQAHLHELAITVDFKDDANKQNNTYYTYVAIAGMGKTLIISGDNKSDYLADILSSSDLDIDAVDIGLGDMPESLAQLLEYDEVILMNIKNEDLSDSFVHMLDEYVYVHGHGLLTTGGGRAYVMEDMKDSDYAQMLPIEASIASQPLALMIIIDASSSMEPSANNNFDNRISVARDAAIASVNCLKDTDYVGVMTFSTSPTLISPLTSIAYKDTVIAKIKGITTGVGTYYYQALNLALREFNGFAPLAQKHIIFITDGAPADSGYMGIINNFKDITLSTVGIGNFNINLTILQSMATAGNGRFHHASGIDSLVDIMIEETTVNTFSFLNEGNFIPKIETHNSLFVGVNALPYLSGYYAVKAKANASIILSKSNNPIYAVHNYGAGKVASFMSDLGGVYSNAFLKDDGIKFIVNVLMSLLSDKADTKSNIDISFSDQNYTTMAVVTTNKACDFTFNVYSPAGELIDIAFDKLSVNAASLEFKLTQSGVYTLQIFSEAVDNQALEELVVYKVFSYSSEYDMFIDDEVGLNALNEIAADGGGRIVDDVSSIFALTNRVKSDEYNFRLSFLIAAICLFLLDIFIRKVKFKRDKRRNDV